MTENLSPKIERWFYWPPLAALLLLLLLQFTDSNVQLFMWLNRRFEFAGDMFWITLMTFGDGLVVCVLLLPFVRRKPELVWAMLISWFFVTLWVQGLKFSFNVPRPLSVLSPDVFHVAGAQYKSKSFPSGHAATAAMFAATFCLIFRQKWVRACVITLALLISLSRIAMGIHWPMDVLAGFLGGWLSAALGYLLAMRLRFGITPVAQIIFGLVLFAAAIRMLIINHTDYAEAFRLQQTIALACLVCLCCEIWFHFRQRRKNAGAN